MCYAQARYYSPENGRFISEDIVRGVPTMPDTVNHYLYCLNDPKVYVDKDGAFLHILAGAAAGALTGAVVAGVHSVLTEGHVDWATVGGAAIGGAVTGAVVAACPAAAPAAVGALGGGTTSLAIGILKGESAGQIAVETVIGAGAGALGGAMFGKIASYVGKGVTDIATTYGSKVISSTTAQTVGQNVGEFFASTQTGGILSVGFNGVSHLISGEKYTFKDAGKDYLIGCADGVAGWGAAKLTTSVLSMAGKILKSGNAKSVKETVDAQVKAPKPMEKAGAGDIYNDGYENGTLSNLDTRK